MTENAYNRMTVTQYINGVKSIVNTEPGEIYRKSRPSASGLDPEGEGRKPR
jgi:hypothetical protein